MDSVFHYYNTSSIVASIFRNNPGGLEGTLGHWHKGWAKDGKNIKKTGPRNEKNNQTYIRCGHFVAPPSICIFTWSTV